MALAVLALAHLPRNDRVLGREALHTHQPVSELLGGRGEGGAATTLLHYTTLREYDYTGVGELLGGGGVGVGVGLRLGP